MLAINRDGWRQRAQSISGDVHTSVVNNDELPAGTKRKTPTSLPPNLPSPKHDEDVKRVKRYVKRDAHEAFFRPAAKRKRGSKVKPRKAKKKNPNHCRTKSE